MAYGDRRDYPRIETWHKGHATGAGRPLVTTWAKTVKEAREHRAALLGVSVNQIGGCKL